MSTDHDQEDDDATDRDPVSFGTGTPAGEWAMALVGALIVAFLLVVLVHQSLTTDTATPTFQAQVVSVAATGDVHVVTVEVTNTGGTAASAIMVIGRSQVATAPALAQIDHLAAGASATVGLVMPSRTAANTMDVRVAGFRHP